MKVLVVDDHAHNRNLLSFILEDEGHECVEAQNGKEAIDTFSEDMDLDIILMDINMPEMDGVAATKVIKGNSEGRFVPVIFVTALGDAEIIANCLEAGGDDFVPKPVNENVLIAKINAHGRSRSLYKNLQEANRVMSYHKQIMDREHLVIERVFLNESNRVTTTCDNVKKYTSPASMFDGDLVLTAPSPSGGVYVLVGDFTGHGLGASIGSLPVTDIFFNLVSKKASVAQIASDINARLFDFLPSNMFFCAAIIYIEADGSEFTIWSGGMNDILCVSPEQHKMQKIVAEHMPLGILDQKEFEEDVAMMGFLPGTKIYVYTDGVNEAMNDSQEEFGLERLEAIVCEGGDNVVERVTDAVHEFCGDSEQNDDISIVEISVGEIVHRSKSDNEIVDVGADYHSAHSFPWTFNMRLEDEDLRNTSIVNEMLGFIGNIHGIELHRDKIFMIVSELYSNALEHGVLGLCSSIKSSADGFEKYYQMREERLNETNGHSIELEFSYLRGDPNQVKLMITDSGEGFDVESKKKEIEQNDESHGRGIDLLDNLCSRLEYSNGGRTVTAVYDLCR